MITYGIAANALNAPHHTGVERYLVSLLREMMAVPLEADEKVLLYVSRLPSTVYHLPPRWEFRVLPFSFGKGWTHLRLSWELWRNPPDVFFNPTHEVPLKVYKKTKIVSTVHDLAFKKFPGSYDVKATRRQAWAIRRAVKKSSRLLAISETTKHDLQELFSVPADRISVTQLGVNPFIGGNDDADALRRHRLSAGRYVLYVGRLEGKKNVAMLVRAFGECKAALGEGHPLQLALAGQWGFGRERIEAAILDVGDDVRVLGFVADEDLGALYRGARAFCFPSYYEGFGLPILEAFAADTPVIASTAPALREVAGTAELFAPPEDAHAWAEAMRTLVMDEEIHARLRELGALRVKDFAWSTTAQETWQALRDVCSTTSGAN